MLWEDKVAAWKADEVTKAFFAEIKVDIMRLTDALIEATDPDKICRIQGMIRSLRGVVDMPEDGIAEHKTKKE